MAELLKFKGEDVGLDKLVMNQKEFISDIEKNIKSPKYDVKYNEEESKIYINCKSDAFVATIDDDAKNNLEKYPFLKKLTLLASIKTRYNEIKKLKNKNFSIKKYFSNLFEDICESFSCIFDEDFRLGKLATIVGFAIIGGIGALAGQAHWSVMLIGIFLSLFFDVVGVTVLGIHSRFDRLLSYVCNLFENGKEIKKLKKSNKEDFIEMREIILSNGEAKYVPVENNVAEDSKRFENPVPEMINNILDTLIGVDKVDVTDIKEELDDLIHDYREMALNKDESDKEIFIVERTFFDRINNLQLRANEARLADGKIEVFNASRLAETDYLLDKLNSLDPKGPGRSKKLR